MIINSYKWLLEEKLPPMLKVALGYLGVSETPGSADNPTILKWSRQLGIKQYRHDSRAWCGLFMGIVAKLTGQAIPRNPLKSLNWVNVGFGRTAPELGDILIFKEKVGGHIGLYVGEGKTVYHVLGGNQGNMVNIVSIRKEKLYKVRRPRKNTKINYPNIRKIYLDKFGNL